MDRSTILGVIPARYGSSRFPGKPLVPLLGKPMIQWVYEAASTWFTHVVIATDDRRIAEAAEAFGSRAIMSSPNHDSGTDRCLEALQVMEDESGDTYTHVVNIQGDEPMITAESFESLMKGFENEDAAISTLIKCIQDKKAIADPNTVKVVTDGNGRALYFSRSPIPYTRDESIAARHFMHIGLYGFRAETLRQIGLLEPSSLEIAEKLEQLRWLEAGMYIQTVEADHEGFGIDTEEDLQRAKEILIKR